MSMNQSIKQPTFSEIVRRAFGLPDTPQPVRDLRGYSAGRVAEKRQRRREERIAVKSRVRDYKSSYRPAHVIAIALHETTGDWVLVQKGTENAGVQKKPRPMSRAKVESYIHSLKLNGYQISQSDNGLWITARMEARYASS